MLKKAKLYSFLAIIVTSTIIGLVNPTLVSAQVTTGEYYGHESPHLKKQTQDKLNATALMRCLDTLANYTHGGMQVSSAKGVPVSSIVDSSTDWLTKTGVDELGKDTRAGYLVNPENGKISCHNQHEQIIEGYKSATGYRTPNGLANFEPFAFMCSLGFRPVTLENPSRNNSSYAWSEMEDRDSIEECAKAASPDGVGATHYVLDPAYVPNHNFALENEEVYMAARYTFLTQCVNGDAVGFVDQLGDQEHPFNTVDVAIAYEDRDEPRRVRYRLDNPGKEVAAYYNDNENFTCGALPDIISNAAQFYITNWLNSEDRPANDADSSGDNENPTINPQSTCNVDGIGWLICPLSNSIAKGIDGIFGLFTHFLEVEPLSTDTGSGTYSAWGTFRNYANIFFVIIFLVVIYSQITGGGISSYTIKTMVPRLVVGAILVNTSYWVSAVAVDIANILGSALQDLFMEIRSSAVGDSAEIPTWDIVTTSVLTGSLAAWGGWSAVVSAGGVPQALWGLLPLLAIAVLSVFVALVVLAARQALIIILIVISPLAFAAFILPNTQKWFDRWKDLLTVLLIMFPIMSVLFGGSQLAASIIMNNATNFMTVLLALCIQVVPLAITPFVIKLSGSLLGRFAGIVNNPTKGPIDSVRNYAKDRQDLGRREALGSDNPSFFARRLRGREMRRRTREERGRTADLGADTHYEEYASGNPEITDLRRRASELEARSESAKDISTTNVTNLLAGDAASRALLASAENAKLDRKASEENLEGVVAPLVSMTSRINEAEATLNKETVQEGVEAGVRKGINIHTIARNEGAKLDRQAAEKEVERDVTPLVSRTSRSAAKVAELQAQAAENLADAATINTVDPRLAGAAHEAGLQKKMAEEQFKGNSLANTSNDIKVQAEASSERLAAVEADDKRAYEETIAGTLPTGVNPTTMADAQKAREDLSVASKATEGAKRVSTKQATENILNDPTLATRMAGIDPGGERRVKAAAEAAQTQAKREELNNNLELLRHEAFEKGKTLKQYAIEIVEGTARGSITPPDDQVIEAALEAAAQDGQVSVLREARTSKVINQDILTNVLTRNAETMKQKGGYDLQNDPSLAGVSPVRMRLSQAANFGEIASTNMPAVKAGEWKDISNNIVKLINTAEINRGTKEGDNAIGGLEKAYIAVTEALRNPDTRGALTDRMDETLSIYTALDAKFNAKHGGTLTGYDIDLTKPPKDW